jgi:hypothetical protein
MSYVPNPPQEPAVRRTNWVLLGVAAGFIILGAAMLANLWGHPTVEPRIPLVDTAFLDQTASRKSYADLVREKEDLSDFKCYVCHDKKEPPVLKFDDQHNVVIPEEHAESIKMGHGSHNRNNLCFNCHNETNLLTFSIRDGKELKFGESSSLCGSCHGPNLRDWEAGVHGRINGYWSRQQGEARRLDCVNCHNPHSPRIPSRPPAPPPHILRGPVGDAAAEKPATTH